MLAGFHYLYAGILMVVGSWVDVKGLVLLLRTRRRSAELGVKLGGAYWCHAAMLLVWNLYLLLLLLLEPQRRPLLLSNLLLLVSYLLLWVPRISVGRLEPLALSRGDLFTGIQRLAGKAQIRRPSVYILPPDSPPRLLALLRPPVLIHRRFLDVMSRAEIDSLAARQLARTQRAHSGPANHVLLVGALATVGLCAFLHVGLAGWWLLFLALVAVETAALALYLPRAEMQSDLRAIALTGNPDAFFSAIGESARLTGAALDLPALEKTAQSAGVSPDRLRALLQPQPRPPEDRYPTSGDYVTVGF
ncbi:MAG: hypothetical protein ACLQGV_08880 [Bryobacteraceae bacterium]